MDETTVPINDRENGTRKGYIWSAVDGRAQSKGLFFYYRGGSRSQEVMDLILDGYEGAVQVDRREGLCRYVSDGMYNIDNNPAYPNFNFIPTFSLKNANCLVA